MPVGGWERQASTKAEGLQHYPRIFPFGRIKIDQNFVRGLGEREDPLAIVRAVIGLGRNLGMTTTAEGVETGDQFDVRRDERCDEVQGFLFSPAVPLKETHRLLASVQSSMSGVARTVAVATAG
jgi:EAL domain-containing protein (putative c-di-GMP-specific phosphodiesterase class I)